MVSMQEVPVQSSALFEQSRQRINQKIDEILSRIGHHMKELNLLRQNELGKNPVFTDPHLRIGPRLATEYENEIRLISRLGQSLRDIQQNIRRIPTSDLGTAAAVLLTNSASVGRIDRLAEVTYLDTKGQILELKMLPDLAEYYRNMEKFISNSPLSQPAKLTLIGDLHDLQRTFKSGSIQEINKFIQTFKADMIRVTHDTAVQNAEKSKSWSEMSVEYLRRISIGLITMPHPAAKALAGTIFVSVMLSESPLILQQGGGSNAKIFEQASKMVPTPTNTLTMGDHQWLSNLFGSDLDKLARMAHE